MIDAVPILQLLLGLFSDDLLEVADHGREWMWSGHRAKQIVRVFDIGDPIAQCLIDRVLKNAIAQSDFDHFGSKHPHAGHIQRLTTGIDLPHVDTAFQAEHRTYRGGCHAMLAGTGLGDDAGLAHALDQQRLAERIVDLMRTSVVEILALEEHSRRDAGLLLKQFGEARSLCQWAFPADVALLQRHELLVEFRVGLGFLVYTFKLIQRGNQRFRHVSAAELTPVWTLMLAQWSGFACFHL